MRITIEATKEEFERVLKGEEFLTVHTREVDVRCGKKLIVAPVVAISLLTRNRTMLIQVEGKPK